MLNRYELLEKMGEGGFGEVLIAERRESIKRRVALKILKPGVDGQPMPLFPSPPAERLRESETLDDSWCVWLYVSLTDHLYVFNRARQLTTFSIKSTGT